MVKKLTIEQVRDRVKQVAGYTLIDDAYVNTNTKMTAVDDNGYKYYFTLSNLMFAKAARMVDKSNPYSIHNIKLWMNNNSLPYELLSTEYKGNGSKNRSNELLKLRCENGHVFYRTWNDMHNGHIRCDDCYVRFKTHDQFVEYIDSKYNGEYKIIGSYVNSETKIKVQHMKCGCTFDVVAESLANGHGCPNNLCCKKRGKEHYKYNQNISDEYRHLNRDYSSEYREWRQNVYKQSMFTCDVCGSKKSKHTKIVAHHLNSWDKNDDVRYDVSNGVVLCKECHADFHSKYGFGNNTEAQYSEYKNNYNNTEVKH